MLKLMKYEIVKKYRELIIALSLFGILEVITIVLLLKKNQYTAGGVGLYSVTGVILFIFILVDNINMYTGDLKNKSGYMLFLTPNSGYKILGSKLIIAFLENIVAFIIYFLLGIINLDIVFRIMNEQGIIDLLSQFNININVTGNEIASVFIFGLIFLLGWLVFILSIYLSATIYKSVLSNVKFGGLITFVIFLLVNKILQVVYKLFGEIIMTTSNLNWEISNFSDGLFLAGLWAILLLIVGAALYFITGYLLDKKVNL